MQQDREDSERGSTLGLYGELRALLRHSMVYGIGNIASKLVGFLMIPIYTRHLTPADYGIIELIDLVLAIGGLILYELIVESIFRFYYKYDHARDKQEVISSALIAHLVLSLCIVVTGILMIEDVARAITRSADYHNYFLISFISFVFMQLKAVPLGFLRVKQKSWMYVGVSLASLVLGLGLNIYLIVFKQMGIYGVLYSSLISNALIATVLGFHTIAHVGFRLSLGKCAEMVRYGGPMIPSGVGMFILNFSNRFFLTRYGLLSDVGLFALGARFSFMVHALVIQPFLEIWDAKMFQIAKGRDAGLIYTKVLTYFAFVVTFFALAVSMLIEDILQIVATPSFLDAHEIVPILCLGYVLMSFYYHFYVGILLKQKTVYIGIIVGGAAGLNLVLNWLLIPRAGIVGAAWATAVSYFAMSAATYVLSYRLFPIKYEWGRIFKLVGTALAFYLISSAIPVNSVILSLGVRLLLLSGFPFALWLVGFYRIEEIGKIKELATVVMVKLRMAKVAVTSNLFEK